MSGSVLSLENDATEGDAFVCHRNRGVVPDLGYHLVERVFYESSDYLLIEPATAHQTVLPDTPVVSPGASRVLVVSMDFEAGYEPNLLQVWRVTPDSLVREWELITGDAEPASGWGASDPVWISDTVAEVTKNEPQDPLGSTFRRSRVRLVRQPDGRWTVEPAPER